MFVFCIVCECMCVCHSVWLLLSDRSFCPNMPHDLVITLDVVGS